MMKQVYSNSFKKNLLSIPNKRLWSRIKGLTDKYLQDHPYASSPALLDSNTLLYSEMRHFQAYLTKNSYDMSIYNESNVYPHVNFGTIDNPVLIFGAGTTWRMVICSGPGSEEESSSHEKMYFMVREGPIHRCHICGQCFKLVKLKDELNSADNIYYSSVFTEISDNVVGSVEGVSAFSFGFTINDGPSQATNVIPYNRAFVFVNNDENDRLFCDPSYRMSYYSEAEKYLEKSLRVLGEVERQYELAGLNTEKEVISKDVYETWVKIEKDILHFDRLYNRYEKFAGRRMFDPDNHERREKRMLQRKHDRLEENYTFYTGSLTEAEQMYRDYYESDLEEFPDDDYHNEVNDNENLRIRREFDMNKYIFSESVALEDSQSPVEDHIESLLFKFRYRQFSDKKYSERQERVLNRFLERTKNRDSRIVKDFGEKLEEIYSKKGLFSDVTKQEDELLPYAEYVAEEGFVQFKDYYESDLESGKINKEILDDLPIRDRLRFGECFVNDLTKKILTDKYYYSIPKRSFDTSKSIVHNFVEDLIDFNYRVRPLARTLAFKDVASKYQSLPVNDEERRIADEDHEKYKRVLDFSKSGRTKGDELLRNKNKNKH